jgi:hypothetical protein
MSIIFPPILSGPLSTVWKRRRDLDMISVNLGSNLGSRLLLWNFNFTPIVGYIPFAFLIEEAAIIFSQDMLSGTTK